MAMKRLIEPLLQLETYQELLSALDEKLSPILTVGVSESQKNHLLYAVGAHKEKSFLVVTYNDMQAKKIYEDLQFFLKEGVYLFPSKDLIFYSADVHSLDIVHERFKVLRALLEGKVRAMVLSIEALFDPMIPEEDFKSFILSLGIGQIIQMEDLGEKLITMGYERVPMVESRGQFSVRGGILDLFPLTEDTAYRIEFFDDEIDSIRELNTTSQRSDDKVKQLIIYPARELLYPKEWTPLVIEQMKQDLEKTMTAFGKKEHEKKERLRERIGEILEKLSQGIHIDGIEQFFKYFYHEPSTLLEYLPQEFLVALDEPLRIRERGGTLYQEFEESMKTRLEQGYILPKQAEILFEYAFILKSAKKLPLLLLQGLAQNSPDFKPKKIVHFTTKTMHGFHNQIQFLMDDLKNWKEKKYDIVILAGTKGKAQRLMEALREQGVESVFLENLEGEPQFGQILITTGSLHKGFEYPLIHFAIVSDKEIFGEEKKSKKRKRKSKKGRKIESFTDLKVSDYVVHDVHGIGIYRGIEKIAVDGVKKDYMKISYADGGSVYVPTNQMDLIQKYIGAEAKQPKLNKLGGAEWKKAKAKVKKSIEELAHSLVELYAKRNMQKGYPFSKDTVWQNQFEEMFPYEETEDQLISIEEVKKDMESERSMDRLLCGDVGYGKTEVAIRAAFKAVQDSKQVAYLVPTTILAQQHYSTFVQRMKDFPIKIGLLSRFKTPAQQKEVIKGLKDGTIDIVIGTHRILSKDLKYKDLGLLIIDEEQRFGVSHKEKIKALKTNVDVLTLTATPIPRTLHMSLTGIRDMSVLEEPPEERYPVQTYVMEHNPPLLRDAILREVARGGQVFYVYNKVKDIHEVAQRLQQLVPEVKIHYAHGQMGEHELEEKMLDFIDGVYDVLVCTTIIETGLDISNVNTIIIQDADHMGLSQLYQLRGRVGRSNRLAYAYLTYRKDKVLQETAEKRLQAIKEFTEFGSGFKIAMRDLEIRGTGNLLGPEQHGHMASVGYDMYTKLLEEAVLEVKGEAPKEKLECSIDVSIDAYIPESYISDEEQKIEAYKKIASIITEEDLYAIQEELEDRYGDLPKAVNHLLQISYSKSLAEEIGIFEVNQRQDKVIFKFTENASLSDEIVKKLIENYKKNMLFTTGKFPYITYALNTRKKDEILSSITVILQMMKGLK